MTERPRPTSHPEPTLRSIARLLEQTIAEGQETRARLDSQTQIMTLRFDGFQKQLDAAGDRSRAEFLTLTNDIADVRKHVGTIEEHVGLLTTKVADHDRRFDQVDARFDQVDARFDQVDARFDQVDARLDQVDTRLNQIDTRLDAHDKRFDQVDARLDTLTEVTIQIRDAVLPRK